MKCNQSRIWTRVAASNSCDDNHYTTGISILISYHHIQCSNRNITEVHTGVLLRINILLHMCMLRTYCCIYDSLSLFHRTRNLILVVRHHSCSVSRVVITWWNPSLSGSTTDLSFPFLRPVTIPKLESSLLYNLSIAGERIIGLIPFIFLVSLFKGLSISVGYLMLKPSL